MVYSGMWEKGLASFSWQKGSLPTVQISVSCTGNRPMLALMHLPLSEQRRRLVDEGGKTHGLESLALLRLERTSLEGNDFRGSIRIVGDGRATLGAEDAMDILARGALARECLDGAPDGELVLGDDGNESFSCWNHVRLAKNWNMHCCARKRVCVCVS